MRQAIATLVGRGVGVSLIPDTVIPQSVLARTARIALPLDSRPRLLGVLWQRASIHARLIDIFVKQAKVLSRLNDSGKPGEK